ncbi:hypothetical protein J3E74DRAFT_442477 [Bipolaris maydis]|nr:hypothetical protein J3E74DRAFT_442477 [Bipolaris maydis]
MAKMLQQSPLAAIKKCLDSGEYSDLTITCGNDVYKVHKMILCTQSDFLAGAIRFPGKESEQANINLPNDEPAVVKLGVKYLYTGDYTYDPQELPKPSSLVLALWEKPSHNEEGEPYTYDFPHSCCDRGRKTQCPPLCPHHQCGAGVCDNKCFEFVCGSCEDGDYSPYSTTRSLAEDLLVHTKMYEMADKYNIAGFKREIQWIRTPIPPGVSSSISMASEAETQILGSIKSSLISGLYSDLKITCGPDSYNVHKLIVCPRAEFFTRALKFGGQYLYEGDYQLPASPSSAKPAITPPPPINPNLPTHTPSGLPYTYDFPHTCRAPLTPHFLCPHHTCIYATSSSQPGACSYTCRSFTCPLCTAAPPSPSPSLPPPPPPTYAGAPADLLLHAQLYAVAEKYQVSGLKPLVTRKFSTACAVFWREAHEFVAAARVVFESTPDSDCGLRGVVVQTLFDHLPDLIARPEVEALLVDKAEVALRLLEMTVAKRPEACACVRTPPSSLGSTTPATEADGLSEAMISPM